MNDHVTITFNTDVLDQVAKSVMLSITANTKRRRRLDPTTRNGREAAEEYARLEEALHVLTQAQRDSWANT